MKKVLIRYLDNTKKRDRDTREKKKKAIMDGKNESSEEERPYNKFSKQVNIESLPMSPVLG
jgi:hypothetical protein